jgi:hypothetical protein
VNAEFNVWLLIVGLVLGAGLVWLVIMDTRRREVEIDSVERPREAAWLSAVMIEDGFDVSPDAAERMLELHRAYLEAPPPDALVTGEVTTDADDVETVDEAAAGVQVTDLDRAVERDRTAERVDETLPRAGA